jgi:dUTP pyrophosphatase
MKFEIVSKYADADLSIPIRKTKASAGYDFQVAEDIVIPAYKDLHRELAAAQMDWSIKNKRHACTLEETAALTKQLGAKPTLVPTGIKCEMPEDMYLELSVRSSCPLKHWLILANGVGIIDADYYNNPDNEGHIFFQIINLAPFPIALKKGDAIGQGIFKKYYLTDDDTAAGERNGGFGSTDNIIEALANVGLPNTITPDECKMVVDLEQGDCVMTCNPYQHAYVFGSPKTFTTEHYDVEYSRS